ncbi:membrane protein [Nocardia wallacei]|uniref:Membrane protein n=1 Tax=Nocardia wallacei TaxID=480035 RepID=A0A7G1KKN9_9NOCA|nr:membrane protein [Nocardia wallacei]
MLVAIIAIGPITVAAGMFPAATRRAAASGADRDHAVVAALHRICRVYAVVGLAVPVLGFGTASSLGVLGDAWLIASIVLTAAAAAVLAVGVLPRQAALLGDEGVTALPGDKGVTALPGDKGVTGARAEARTVARLTSYTGIFNLLWVIVTVLMIVRPGSTTGA